MKVAAIEAALGPPEQRRFVALGRKATLDAGEQKELERLVEAVAPGLMQAAKDSREGQARRLQERQEGAQGKPRRVLLEEGWAALPAGLLEDVFAGELRPVDLTYFSTVALTLSTGRIGDFAARSGSAYFADDGALVVRGGGRRLLEDWDVGATEPGERVISLRLSGTLDRLAAGGTRGRAGGRRGAFASRPEAGREGGVSGSRPLSGRGAASLCGRNWIGGRRPGWRRSNSTRLDVTLEERDGVGRRAVRDVRRQPPERPCCPLRR